MSLAIYDKNINGNIQKQHGTDISEYAFRAIFMAFAFIYQNISRLRLFFNIHY